MDDERRLRLVPKESPEERENVIDIKTGKPVTVDLDQDSKGFITGSILRFKTRVFESIIAQDPTAEPPNKHTHQ